MVRITKQLTERIWEINGEWVKHCGINYPFRGFILELHTNIFCVISPVGGGQELFDEVNQIVGPGELKYIVLPNKMHCRYMTEWSSSFPGAFFLFPDDCLKKVQKRSQIKNYFLLNKEVIFDYWRDVLAYEIVEGSSFMKEAVFYFIPDKSLIVADLIQKFDLKEDKYNEYDKMMLKMGGLVGRGGIPVFYRASFKWPFGSKQMAQNGVAKITAWDFEQILVSHGKHVKQNSKAIFMEMIEFFK